MYALIINDVVVQYPYSARQLRLDNPGISFPFGITDERLADWGVYPVQPVAKPVDITLDITEGTPVNIAGVWTQVWNTTPASGPDVTARLDKLKKDKLDALKAVRAAKQNTDLTVGARTLDITDELRVQIRELKEYSDANTGATLKVLMPSGKTANVTRAQLLAVHNALAARTKDINDVAVVKADAIAAATTAAEVQAVDLNTGWPV